MRKSIHPLVSQKVMVENAAQLEVHAWDLQGIDLFLDKLKDFFK